MDRDPHRKRELEREAVHRCYQLLLAAAARRRERLAREQGTLDDEPREPQKRTEEQDR